MGFQLDADAGFSTGDDTSHPQPVLSGLTPLVPVPEPSVSSDLGISPEMQAKLSVLTLTALVCELTTIGLNYVGSTTSSTLSIIPSHYFGKKNFSSSTRTE